MKALLSKLFWTLFNKYRFKDSLLYERYLKVFYPSHALAMCLQRKFFEDLILTAGGGTVFDIGANGGDKTAIFIRYARRVVSVEPSPGAIDVLRQRFLRKPKVVIVPKGVGATEGSANLHVFGATDGLNTFSNAWADSIERGDDRDGRPVIATVKASITTLDQLVAEYGPPCYIKIDVEGYEIHAVRGLSRSVPLLSFECNLPQFQEESARIVTILADRNSRCSFNYCITEPPARFNNDTWMTASSIVDTIQSGLHPFMEIFCRSDVLSK